MSKTHIVIVVSVCFVVFTCIMCSVCNKDDVVDNTIPKNVQKNNSIILTEPRNMCYN